MTPIHMLKQRIFTALALLLVLLPAVFYSDIRFLAFIGLILIGASTWEWARLNHCSQIISIAWGFASVAICSVIYFTDSFFYFDFYFWTCAAACWVLLGGYLLQGGHPRWLRTNQIVRMVSGLSILVSSWIAIYLSKSIGTGFLLSILILVWVADIAAYFAGRRWGRHKLAPHISPGKSWEGLVGGVVGVFALSFMWLALDDVFPILQEGLFQKLHMRGWLIFSASILFMTLMSVVGDLVESLIKRSVGAKDSSNLLPGHGGLLDRLDAMLPVLAISMMLNLAGAST